MSPQPSPHCQLPHDSRSPLCRPAFPVVKILPLLCVLFSTIASAQTRNWRVADFQDTISVATDGTALVSEKITLAFVGEWHGIHRTIPVEYPGADGSNYTLFLQVISG